MTVALLPYSYNREVYSLCQLARGCEEGDALEAVMGLDRPDFRAIGDFRLPHLETLSGPFIRVLRFCHLGGLVRPGHAAMGRDRLKPAPAGTRR